MGLRKSAFRGVMGWRRYLELVTIGSAASTVVADTVYKVGGYYTVALVIRRQQELDKEQALHNLQNSQILRSSLSEAGLKRLNAEWQASNHEAPPSLWYYNTVQLEPKVLEGEDRIGGNCMYLQHLRAADISSIQSRISSMTMLHAHNAMGYKYL
ncbi:hypothetical protein BS50DRAFT_577076 [Corynespora cassiicola Philippines]|uniref:Uncharacterized protein n=1 Tax=Corynespora cassiicola Philippines TaxID=1448308 RepID=A0A2T2ND00_CORCC|nr:hypothetical protein BS50DRAFT_577076 [Corynespora cassiicola Philippines]